MLMLRKNIFLRYKTTCNYIYNYMYDPKSVFLDLTSQDP